MNTFAIGSLPVHFSVAKLFNFRWQYTLVSGIWHGANWTFIIWGVIHGILQIIEKALGLDPKGKFGKSGLSPTPGGYALRVVRISATFVPVSLAWIFFRSPSIGDACSIIGKIFTGADGLSQAVQFQPVIALSFLLLVVKEFGEEFFPSKLQACWNKSKVLRWCAYLFMVAFIILYGVLDATQFIYVSF